MKPSQIHLVRYGNTALLIDTHMLVQHSFATEGMETDKEQKVNLYTRQVVFFKDGKFEYIGGRHYKHKSLDSYKEVVLPGEILTIL